MCLSCEAGSATIKPTGTVKYYEFRSFLRANLLVLTRVLKVKISYFWGLKLPSLANVSFKIGF